MTHYGGRYFVCPLFDIGSRTSDVLFKRPSHARSIVNRQNLGPDRAPITDHTRSPVISTTVIVDHPITPITVILIDLSEQA